MLLQWALYPRNKGPNLVDTKKMFGHLMVQRVGEMDPLETTDLNVNVENIQKLI